MKIVYILFLTVLFAQSFESKAQDRNEQEFNYMMSELARVHKGVFALPFSYEYIKTTFMVEIEAKRLIIAPHYPTRQIVGDDEAVVHNAFVAWYQNYPMECSAYISYVDLFITEHQ